MAAVEKKNIGDLCVECHRSTSFGSGLFVNRIPADSETEIGWLCPECQAIKCDYCGDLTLEFTMLEDGSVICDSCENPE